MTRKKIILIGVLCLSAGVIACGHDATGPNLIDSSQLYWNLTLNHHAITMAAFAPYDTLQLHATPRVTTGAAIADTGETTYTSTDTTVATVSVIGLLRAVGQGTSLIVAAHSYQGLTRADTAEVQVSDQTPIPQFTTLTLALPVGDSAVFGFSDYSFPSKQLQSQALDQANTPISSAHIRYTSSDTAVATINQQSPSIFGHKVGATMLYAEATIYGVRRVDSLPYTIGYPIAMSIEVLSKAGSTTPYFSPGTVTINVGGTVAWYSAVPNGQSVDVTFDMPSAAHATDSAYFANVLPINTYGWYNGAAIPAVIPTEGGGNIPNIVFDSVCVGDIFENNHCGNYAGFYYVGHARTFPTVGSYPYHSTYYGITGVVNVVRNP